MVIFFLIVGPFIPLFVWLAIHRWGRRRRIATPQPAARCRCGYELDQLDTIRCPECGRVRGFDATAEDLGLTPEQLQVAKAKRDARRLDPSA